MSFVFKGDADNEEEVYRFIVDSLPHLSPPIHEQLTALMLGNTENCTPALDAIIGAPNVKEVVASLTDRYGEQVKNHAVHTRDHIATFFRFAVPGLTAKQRSILSSYILAKELEFQIPEAQAQCVRTLCSQRSDVRNTVNLLLGNLDDETFTDRYADRF